MPRARAPRYALALLAGAFALTVSSPRPVLAQSCGVCGDTNGDGLVNIVDALFVAQHTVGLRPVLPCAAQADVKEGGVLDIVDALYMAQYTVELRPILCFRIDSPEALASFGDSPITVTGKLTGLATVACNGAEATVDAGGFTAEVPLDPSENVIDCIATRPNGMIASTGTTATLDNVAPVVVIDSPSAGAITSATQVDVTGVVNDVLTAFNAPPPAVRVNGVLAAVSNRTFVAAGVNLKPGPNTLQAIATDSLGNTGQTSITLTRLDLAGQSIEMVSGNGQTAMIGASLPDPLIVELVDALGNSVPNRAVRFVVTRGSGTLAGADGNGQQLDVNTDSNGRASVVFTLGANAGQGSHRVTATAIGFVGEVVFCASAEESLADHIVVISGDNQRGIVGEVLPLSLITQVVDLAGNPVHDIPVTYTILEGQGSFGGATPLIVMTGPDGKAAATLRLGPAPGINNNRVQATFPGLAGLPAIFTASAASPGLVSETSVSGVVLDNSDLPVPGVTAFIGGTSLSDVADEEGRFHIDGVPVGPLQLLIHGATTTREGEWPNLELDLVTLAGQDNTVGGPIRLPRLDEGSAQIVGGNADVTLTMADVPGASLTVFANSATFAGGAPTGLLSITQVHFDKVPMPPPNGSQFTIAWTIQPPGVRFNPPARVTIPNNGGPPGSLVEMFWFDHDLSMFVQIGTASVSADGSVMQSDPGFGVAKSGWGGCTPPPPPPKCVAKCGPCKKCENGTCISDATKNGMRCTDMDQTMTMNGVNYTVDDSCKGVCKDGVCGPTIEGFSVSAALSAAKAGGDKFNDSCIMGNLKTTLQNCLQNSGFNVRCDASGSACASAHPGSNTLTLTPRAFNVAACDALESSSLHEIVHACGNFRHRKCDNAGNPLGEIACTGSEPNGCVVCVDPSTDKAYGCERSCFPLTGSMIGNASACQ